ncbi:MAG: hypothetical protein HN718_14470 [Rhodospirillales bacterium]|nr:hypothetical protein [Rhodospirillales bacterium]
MKNIILAVAITTIVLSGAAIGSAKAGWWEKIVSLTLPMVEAKEFAIEASGWNLRGYVFAVEELGRMCMYVAGDAKGGLDCWEGKQ